MELLKDIMMNIYLNMYSYTCYVIIGIVLYIIINFLAWKLNFNIAVLKVVVILLALFLPICSCISITFLLYKRIIKDEKFVLAIYLLSIFFNISGFLLIYLYFGIVVLSIYVLILAFILIILYIILSKIEKKQNNISDCNDEKYKNITNLYYISNFVFIHFISIVIASVINAVFKNVQYIDVAGTNKNLPIFIFNNIVLNYFCIPNDILKMSQYMYVGYSVSFIIPMIYIATIMNLPDFILIITRFKYKLFYYIATLLTGIVTSIVFYIFDSNDMISKTSINYNDNMYKWASILNVNPGNYIRIISIIIYILLLLYYSQKKGELKL